MSPETPIGSTSLDAVRAAATKTFEIKTAAFKVQPGAEAFGCQDFKNPAGKDIAIVEASSTMSQGIFQTYVFHDSSITSNTKTVANCDGVTFLPYIHLAQSPTETTQYPSGVGRSLPGTDGLRVNLHALNSGTTALSARFDATFQWVAPTKITHLAAELYLNNGTTRSSRPQAS